MSASSYPDTNASTVTDDRSVGELERDAERRRERVGDTLDELESRLSPDRWVDNAVGLFKEHGGDISEGLQRSVKSNPLPVILTGIGIAWMMLGQRDGGSRPRAWDDRGYAAYPQPRYDTRSALPRGGEHTELDDDAERDEGDALLDRVGSAVGDMSDSVTRSARDMQGSAQQRMSSMRQTSTDAAGSMQGQFSDYREQAGQRAEEWRGEAQRFLEEQPLVAGGMGIALGALLGALLPSSEGEQRLARQAVQSDAGQRAIEDAKSAAQSVQEKVHDRIDETTRAAREKIEEAKSEASVET